MKGDLHARFYERRRVQSPPPTHLDVSPDPRAEARLYCSSPDITTVVLADSAHCHNMASSRHRLWRRLLGWTETVARQ